MVSVVTTFWEGSWSQRTQAVDPRRFKLSLTGTLGRWPGLWIPGDSSCHWQEHWADHPSYGPQNIQAVIDRYSGQMTRAMDPRRFKLSLTGTVGRWPGLWIPRDSSCHWQVQCADDPAVDPRRFKLSLTGTVGRWPRLWIPGDSSCHWQVQWADHPGCGSQEIQAVIDRCSMQRNQVERLFDCTAMTVLSQPGSPLLRLSYWWGCGLILMLQSGHNLCVESIWTSIKKIRTFPRKIWTSLKNSGGPKNLEVPKQMAYLTHWNKGDNLFFNFQIFVVHMDLFGNLLIFVVIYLCDIEDFFLNIRIFLVRCPDFFVVLLDFSLWSLYTWMTQAVEPWRFKLSLTGTVGRWPRL